ncbi:hypothetical protein NVP1124O_43 [Vibrio phage 1.124.O._10N.286.49.B1]|nr:hypothetical protein NVP1124O_43 [Vibrio phage 1.124.O._10N.286.49.B1]
MINIGNVKQNGWSVCNFTDLINGKQVKARFEDCGCEVLVSSVPEFNALSKTPSKCNCKKNYKVKGE